MNALVVRTRANKRRRYIVKIGWLDKNVHHLTSVSVSRTSLGVLEVSVLANDGETDMVFSVDFADLDGAWRFVHSQGALSGLPLFWFQFRFTVSMVGLLRPPPRNIQIFDEAQRRYPDKATQVLERAEFVGGARQAAQDWYQTGDYSAPIYTAPVFNAGYIWAAAGYQTPQ